MKIGKVREAESIFSKIEKYTNYSLASLIEGYAKNNCFDKIDELF